MSSITIAIDGYSSCGKSTLARSLAAKLNYAHVDSGAMYRAVALYALQHGLASKDSLDRDRLVAVLDDINIGLKRNIGTFLNGKNVEDDIRAMPVSEVVSRISAVKEVRDKLRSIQQRLGAEGCVVMDGRDIGTVVFPDAELKIFMTASLQIRAKRRYDEMTANGQQIPFEDVLKNVQARDREDSHRKESPLLQAKDAVVIDNSDLTPEQQLELALSVAKERIAVKDAQ